MADREKDTNVISRLASIEEAMKFHAATIMEHEKRFLHQPQELERTFVTKLEAQETYIKRGELRDQSSDRRAEWGLRVMALAWASSFVVQIISLLHK